MTPEQQARQKIDKLLTKAGWHVCDSKAANIYAARGVVIREFRLNPGHGEAHYLPSPRRFATRQTHHCH